ncbi:DUF1707 SHOCT-like domain-containing protein [Gordonia shandongensis]|uniref:DUF1707 SHOCT-like domain-containing protein n=1 Tax=Gordonia shandongensis TaxID=376351 RepID=UPI000415939F|nr:DUF1707 domain-containing protein [Gordonia shandongensis]
MSDFDPAPADSSGGDRPAIRVSTADRERTHSFLSAAMSHGVLTPEEYGERAERAAVARTRDELDALTADLPLDQLCAAALPDETRVSTSGASPVTSAVAIFGGREVGGGAVMGDSLLAVAIFGGVELDLRRVEYTAPVLTITCRAVMGGIRITVPSDVTVEVHGTGVMGGFDGGAAGPGADGAPRVVVRGFSLMGGVDVTRRDRSAHLGPRRAR